ncbi:hypothetical protein O7635_15230 [Asanoa sp. WMMD1127]|uniref:DUF6962 family protein n=1 Tax=Asanoa sp. WMMD1127 TaxID=3016107 RepID=UPI002417BCED|nr:hypothetical protein [Asanoa sp. WMMD1127]MDG4823208.1 hypothetical protein [Asanoa sp. WMMD1127]
MLAQPAQALTDLLLGLVVCALAIALLRRRVAPAHRYWEFALGWLAVSALGGFVHHGFLVRWPSVATVSWTLISVAIVLGVSYLLAATVEEVLGPGHRRVFWLLRAAGLGAYLGLVITTGAGISALILCESITFACIVGLWGWAASRRHPLALPVLIAIVASGAAAATRVIPADLAYLDGDSLYHLAQIVGIVLLYRAITVARRPATAP